MARTSFQACNSCSESLHFVGSFRRVGLLGLPVPFIASRGLARIARPIQVLPREDCKVAFQCIQQSKIFHGLKQRILAMSRGHAFPEQDQVALDKLGKYTKTRWSLLHTPVWPRIQLRAQHLKRGAFHDVPSCGALAIATRASLACQCQGRSSTAGKGEALHAEIKTSVLLFDFGESMALDSPESLHLAEALDAQYNIYKPQSGSGYDGSTALKRAQTVPRWATLLEGHLEKEAYGCVVQAVREMLQEDTRPPCALKCSLPVPPGHIMFTRFPDLRACTDGTYLTC
jgi:hypothetical protein